MYLRGAIPSVLLVLLAAGGCAETRVVHDGTVFVVRQQDVRLKVDGELDCTAEHGQLRTVGGRILLNRVDYGPIAAGDTLVWERDGRLLVNGEERRPSE